MVRYYYDKYNVIESEEYKEGVERLRSENSSQSLIGGARSYSFNKKDNRYIMTPPLLVQGDTVSAGTSIYYEESGDMSLSRYVPKTSKVLDYYGVDCTAYTRPRGAYPPEKVYTRGTLVQSSIAAENGTYPTNGRHSDGYWYVRGSMINTAPTTPGAFTAPTGELEIGDSKTFAVGASSDAEGNLSKYIWEASINSASFVKVGETTAPSFNYVIPTATSLVMRVKAADSSGLESTYRTSATFTVTKPKYYFSKYNIVTTAAGYKDDAPWDLVNADTWSPGAASPYSAKGYKFDTKTNTYSLNGDIYGDFEYLHNGISFYFIDKNDVGKVRKYTLLGNGYANDSISSRHEEKLASKNTYTPLTYSRGTLVQSGISAVDGAYPNDGRHTDGYWYVKNSRVNQSIAPPQPFTAPLFGKVFKPNEVASVTFGASTAPSLSLYEVDYRYNENAWVALPYNNTLTRTMNITTDKTLTKLQFRVRTKNTSNVYSDYIYSDIYEIQHNAPPVLTLDTADNGTLYENDSIAIDGQATDADNGQIVNVRYQINGGTARALQTGISDGITPIAFSKRLTFKLGKLYDGETDVSGILSDGMAHTLKVWAEDDQGGKSIEQIRTIFVVANRAPNITIEQFVTQSDLINSDKITIKGTANDPENQNVKVRYNINSGTFTEFFNGAPGAFELIIGLDKLKNGANIVQLQIEDSYGFVTSKTLSVEKTFNSVPITHAVARYDHTVPPTGTTGIIAWVEKMNGDLTVEMDASMKMKGEQEEFAPMTLSNTAPISADVEEKEFLMSSELAKDSVIMKVKLNRVDTASKQAIKKISGTLQV